MPNSSHIPRAKSGLQNTKHYYRKPLSLRTDLVKMFLFFPPSQPPHHDPPSPLPFMHMYTPARATAFVLLCFPTATPTLLPFIYLFIYL